MGNSPPRVGQRVSTGCLPPRTTLFAERVFTADSIGSGNESSNRVSGRHHLSEASKHACRPYRPLIHVCADFPGLRRLLFEPKLAPALNNLDQAARVFMLP